MSLDWYPWFPVAFRKKTLHLTLEQDGAYRRLIDEYMIQRGPLPDNDQALARILGVSIAQWLSIAPVVRQFFEASHDKLVHKRCEKELDTQRILGERRSASGKYAIEARWKKARENKELIRSVYETNTEAIRKHTTLHKKDTLASLLVAAREEKPEQSNGSLATAPLAGALTRRSQAEPLAKRPSEVSRQELETIFAAKRAARPKAALGETP